MTARKTLRELLLEEGILDSGTLDKTDKAALRRGCSLAVALLDEHLLEPLELLDMLRRRLKLPEVDLERTGVEPEALREVPVPIAENHRLLPLRTERRGGRSVLWVAMADPLDRAAIEEIEFTTGCRVEPALAPATSIAAGVKRYYRGMITRVVRDAPTLPDGGETVELQRTPSIASSAVPGMQVRTQPVHRLEDEASPELRVRALLNALIRRELLTEDEYLTEVQELLKSRLGRDE
jgi:hypothetical protein